MEAEADQHKLVESKAEGDELVGAVVKLVETKTLEEKLVKAEVVHYLLNFKLSRVIAVIGVKALMRVNAGARPFPRMHAFTGTR